MNIGEDEAAARRKPARPAHHAADRVAGQVLADAFPHHDRAQQRIEAGIAQTLFEIVDLEIDGDKGHPVQVGAGRLQPLAFHLGRCRGDPLQIP